MLALDEVAGLLKTGERLAMDAEQVSHDSRIDPDLIHGLPVLTGTEYQYLLRFVRLAYFSADRPPLFVSDHVARYLDVSLLHPRPLEVRDVR